MSVKRIVHRLPKLAFPPAARPSSSFLTRATSSATAAPSTSSPSPSPSPSTESTLSSSSTTATPTASSSSTPSHTTPAPKPAGKAAAAPKTPKLSKAEKAEQRKKLALQVAAGPPPPLVPDLRLGDVGPNRLRDFYHNQLADDLLYLTYSHKLAIDPDLPVSKLSAFEQNPTDPYAINRGPPRPKGRRSTIIPVRKAVHSGNVPRLEQIVLSATVREASRQKSQLLGALHMLRTISGQVEGHRGVPTAKGVEVMYAKKGVAAFHVREGMAVGAKLVLEGDEMWRFLETLTEFVMPRLREWKGIRLPQIRNEDLRGEWATQGVVSMGLDPPAMALFPQIEACLDAYPRMYGFNINFKTNQQGFGACDRARLLMSAFRVPFHRPDYKGVGPTVRWKKAKGQAARQAAKAKK